MNASRLAVSVVTLLLLSAQAAYADLFFSEYVEGSSNNKALEIYNPNDTPVDLSNYKIELYSNGATSANNTLTLSGTLAAKSTYVIVHSSATAALIAKKDLLNSGVTAYNGDDALVLKNGNTIIDVIGRVGERPSPAWGTGLTSTLDKTLRRKSSIITGDTNPNDAFDPALEWDGYPIDTFDGLGSHTTTASGGSTGGGSGGGTSGGSICNTADKRVHEVQGSGTSSPLSGQTVTLQGVVTRVLPSLGGYMLQEEDHERDADPNTSEGIFIYTTGTLPNVGDIVAVRGTVTEYFGLTELTTVTQTANCGTATVTPVDVTLPFTSTTDLEKYEGMLVRFPQTLTVTETYWLARLGQLTLSSNGKQPSPTQVAAPGAAALAQATTNSLSRIVLDDGVRDDSYSYQNPDPVQYPGFGTLSYSNPIRGGYTTNNLTGVVHFASNYLNGAHNNIYKIIPAANVNFSAANPRPANAVPSISGDIKIAGYNVLNYFSTLTSAGNVCGPSANMECRGAESATEFNRQNSKLMSALKDIDADIFGLIEIENHPSDTALQTLVSNLNAVVGAGTYDRVNTGVIGTDAIKVALIYKPAKVQPIGTPQIIDYNDGKNRPTLVQTFRPVGGSSLHDFKVAVNHFKSKGSACGTGDDATDGSGNCNQTRINAANQLVTALGNDPKRRVILLGDFNAYAKEEPINIVKAAGYAELTAGHTSYVFDGGWGSLDHAFASPALNAHVTGTATLHINADEPVAFDYNTNFKSATQQTTFYDAGAFRSSDHDPVVVGLNMTCPANSTATQTSPPFTMPANQWTMFGLPLNPVNNRVQDVFSSLNPAQYNSRWVVYEVNNATMKYTKLTPTSTMSVGKAYWAIHLDGAVTLSINGTAVNADNRCLAHQPLYVNAAKNGENAVTNPYIQPVQWADMLIATGSTLHTPAQADSNNILNATFKRTPGGTGADRNNYSYNTPQASGAIAPWEAIWVQTKAGLSAGATLAVPAQP